MSGAWKVLRRFGGKLKAPRKSNAKKDQAKADAFRAELAGCLGEVVRADARRVRVWVLDEHRHGLLPVISRVWGKRGARVPAPCATK